VYGPVRTVVWEDGGREAPSYPIGSSTRWCVASPQSPLLTSGSRSGLLAPLPLPEPARWR